ncbi:MAG: ATP synthase F1 subunit epsilon [Candidatus Cloacimonadota bacterium]|nr:ATP synthase F1 subunit epsilon [Candidatus Cloacimonadota bacterium]
MANLQIKVIRPNGIALADQGDHVILPGVDGDFGISIGHTTFITKIRPGVIQLFDGKNERKYSIHDGFVTVEDDIVTLVTDTFETSEEIDKNRAENSKERAEKRLKDVGSKEIDFRRAEFALKRSVARLEIIREAE